MGKQQCINAIKSWRRAAENFIWGWKLSEQNVKTKKKIPVSTLWEFVYNHIDSTCCYNMLKHISEKTDINHALIEETYLKDTLICQLLPRILVNFEFDCLYPQQLELDDGDENNDLMLNANDNQ